VLILIIILSPSEGFLRLPKYLDLVIARRKDVAISSLMNATSCQENCQQLNVIATSPNSSQ
jgi:hypothetical protein